MITLIHGPAELLRAEAVAAIQRAIAEDEEMASLNTTHIDGRRFTLADLQFACESLPFLAERRLVIVQNGIGGGARPRGDAGGEEADTPNEPAQSRHKVLLEYLDHVPDTCELVLLEDDIVSGGALLRRLLELQSAKKARILTCQKPRGNELASWIRQRAHLHHVELDGLAANDLAEFVGDDLRQLDQELLKLRDAVDRGQVVTRAEVQRLVPATRAANVFDMVEAMANGNAPAASRLLYQAVENDGEQPLRLLALISRQYRLLIQAKALQGAGLKPVDIARELRLRDWTMGRLLSQAARYNFSQLEQAMETILRADESIKTGRLSDREAIDLLLAELMAGGRRSSN